MSEPPFPPMPGTSTHQKTHKVAQFMCHDTVTADQFYGFSGVQRPQSAPPPPGQCVAERPANGQPAHLLQQPVNLRQSTNQRRASVKCFGGTNPGKEKEVDFHP